MAKRYYGVGIQTFEKLRELGAAYVDKTALIYQMTHSGNCFFLSRPRRFGKSLLVSTMEAYFQGRKELFQGLEIEKLETEWNEYPVIHIDFSQNAYDDVAIVKQNIDRTLLPLELRYGLDTQLLSPGGRLRELIVQMHEQTGKKVVVLVDEYDAPLLDVLDKPEQLEKHRAILRDFYKPLKGCDPYLKFVFLTGITKFSQLSIFSALNNLNDVSMLDNYASICGFSEDELYTQLGEDIRELGQGLSLTEDEIKAELKRLYDGYHFSENSPDIYNPFSIITALANMKLTNYWFASGTPSFLAKACLKYEILPNKLEAFAADADEFNTPTESPNGFVPIFYQAGYLTIKGYVDGFYILGFPNNEVRFSFYKTLMREYVGMARLQPDFATQLRLTIQRGFIDDAMKLIRAFMASIPYDAEKQDENHYKTIFYLIFRLLTVYNIRTEERTSSGRCDAMVETQDAIYIFEFKLPKFEEDSLRSIGLAMDQIDQKGYTIPYETSDKTIYKIAATFDDARRTIGTWQIERVRN